MQTRLCVEPSQQVKIGFFYWTKPYVLVACHPFSGSIRRHPAHVAVASVPCRCDFLNIPFIAISGVPQIAGSGVLCRLSDH
jgi:hypothetical protein